MAEPKESRREWKSRRREYFRKSTGKRHAKVRKQQRKSALKRMQYKAKPDPCPYCGREPVLHRDSTPIYKQDHGPVWACPGWPQCDSIIGCHPGTTRPLGTMANTMLRKARKRAHKFFDKLFDPGPLTRQQAYIELATYMDLDIDDCHMGQFDLGQCELAAAFARAKLRTIYKGRLSSDEPGERNGLHQGHD
jgi:hypothetical protein